MKQLIPGSISRHMEDKIVIRSGQHGVTKSKSCLINLLNYIETTGLVDEGSAADIVHLDFSKGLHTVSIKILIEKLMRSGLDEQSSGGSY